MSFGIVLKKAADSLTEQTAFALASFWSGVCVADPRGNTASKILLGRFAGPSGMGPFGRAALIYASAAEAFSPLLDAVIEVAEGWPPLASETPIHFADALLESIETDRASLVLGDEVSVLSIHDYCCGYLAATSHSHPEEAERYASELVQFDAWVRAWYRYAVPWPLLIRCFEGPGGAGCVQFAKLWRRFTAERAVTR